MIPKDEKEIVKCPLCDKRIFDIIKRPSDETIIELKCHRCRKVLIFKINSEAQSNE